MGMIVFKVFWATFFNSDLGVSPFLTCFAPGLLGNTSNFDLYSFRRATLSCRLSNVRGDKCLILGVLILALSCCFSNRLVQSSDGSLERRDFFDKRCHCLFCAGNRRFFTSNCSIQSLFLVLRSVELQTTILFLVIIVHLLLPEKLDEVVDHFDDC